MTDPFPNALAAQLPHLRVIARHGVGYDNVDAAYFGRQGIWVTITPHANATTVAETTLAAIMAAAKQLNESANHMRHGDWGWANQHRGFDLAGKVLGIMGYGRIGRQVAKIARALGMQVLAYDPYAKSDEIAQLVDRPTLFKQADVVSLHMLVTEATRHSIGARELAWMKPTAILVNFGRAALIDHPALQAALRNQQLARAIIDVYDQEPLPPTDPWYTTPRVTLYPHVASNTTECMSRMAVGAASEVVRVLTGAQPQWPVNQVK